MPTYEYLCESCGHRFEVFQHIADAPLTTCPNCSGHIHRVLFATGLVFKGSGFYKTDSRGTSTAATPAPAPHESHETSTSASNGATPTAAPKSETPSTAKAETPSSSGTSTGN